MTSAGGGPGSLPSDPQINRFARCRGKSAPVFNLATLISHQPATAPLPQNLASQTFAITTLYSQRPELLNSPPCLRPSLPPMSPSTRTTQMVTGSLSRTTSTTCRVSLPASDDCLRPPGPPWALRVVNAPRVSSLLTSSRVPRRAPRRRQDPQALRRQECHQGLLEVPQRERSQEVRRQAQDWRRRRERQAVSQRGRRVCVWCVACGGRVLWLCCLDAFGSSPELALLGFWQLYRAIGIGIVCRLPDGSWRCR